MRGGVFDGADCKAGGRGFGVRSWLERAAMMNSILMWVSKSMPSISTMPRHELEIEGTWVREAACGVPA
jgi:hypothetical protein